MARAYPAAKDDHTYRKFQPGSCYARWWELNALNCTGIYNSMHFGGRTEVQGRYREMALNIAYDSEDLYCYHNIMFS